MGPTEPPIRRVPCFFKQGLRRSRREANYLPPFSADVNNVWRCISAPPYAIMQWTELTYLYRVERSNRGITECEAVTVKAWTGWQTYTALLIVKVELLALLLLVLGVFGSKLGSGLAYFHTLSISLTIFWHYLIWAVESVVQQTHAPSWNELFKLQPYWLYIIWFK